MPFNINLFFSQHCNHQVQVICCLIQQYTYKHFFHVVGSGKRRIDQFRKIDSMLLHICLNSDRSQRNLLVLHEKRQNVVTGNIIKVTVLQ